MSSRVDNAMTKFFHDLSIFELRLQNNTELTSKLTYNSMLYIDIISAHQGEYTVSNIADMLYVARPSVTQKLKELEKMGYISKKQSDKDKRTYYLYASKDIIPNRVEQSYYSLNKKIENKLLENYTQDEVNKFFNMLNFIGDVCIDE